MLKLKGLNYNKKITELQFADRTTRHGQGKLHLVITGIQFKDDFIVVKELSEELILGLSFLTRHQVTLDYRSKVIKVLGHSLNMINWTQSAKCTTVTLKNETSKHELNKLVQQYVDSNPTLGLIKETYMYIPLTDPTPIRKRDFPLPH